MEWLFSSSELQQHIEIVLAAVINDGLALKFSSIASIALKRNRQVSLNALSSKQWNAVRNDDDQDMTTAREKWFFSRYLAEECLKQISDFIGVPRGIKLLQFRRAAVVVGI